MHSLRSETQSRRFLAFARNNDGVTAIEFAFVAPVFLLLLMAIIEFSMIMFVNAMMESATASTSRMGKTGYVAAGTTRQAQIVSSIDAKTCGLLDKTKIVITSLVYSNFDKIGKPEPYTDTNHNGMHDSGEPYTDVNGNGQWDADMGAAGLGNAGDVVVYTVSYPWPIMTPVMRPFLGSTYNITTRAVVKNEPF